VARPGLLLEIPSFDRFQGVSYVSATMSGVGVATRVRLW